MEMDLNLGLGNCCGCMKMEVNFGNVLKVRGLTWILIDLESLVDIDFWTIWGQILGVQRD